MSGIKIFTIPSLLLLRLQKFTVRIFGICCFSMLSALFVLSIYSNNFSIRFCIRLKNPIQLTNHAKSVKISRAHFFTKKIAQQTREPVNMRICKKKKDSATSLDKASRLSIRIVIWILPSDTDTDTDSICQLNKNISKY